MTTKKELINKRTWEYFWEQKAEEILLIILGVLVFFLIGIILRIIDVLAGGELLFEQLSFGTNIAYSLFGILIFGFIGFFLYILFIVMKDWIKSNWKKAETEAKRDFK